MMPLQPRHVLGIDLKCSESALRGPNHRRCQCRLVRQFGQPPEKSIPVQFDPVAAVDDLAMVGSWCCGTKRRKQEGPGEVTGSLPGAQRP